MRLKLKSWFQWNAHISLWNAQNSWFPLKSVELVTEGYQGRLVNFDAEIHAFWNTFTKQGNSLVGLSKERPILDHHAKAHIHEIWRISWNPADFIWISWSLVDFRWNPADFIQISGEIWWISYGFQVKSARFHTWNPADFVRISHMISKDQLPGMVSPMFVTVSLCTLYSLVLVLHPYTQSKCIN